MTLSHVKTLIMFISLNGEMNHVFVHHAFVAIPSDQGIKKWCYLFYLYLISMSFLFFIYFLIYYIYLTHYFYSYNTLTTSVLYIKHIFFKTP